MSSPPTPTTSIKAAPLHLPIRKRQEYSSFPVVAALNPFRKRPSKTARSPSPVEPYEVAPGIWNTDATAKVFGYLEPTEHKHRPRGRSAGRAVGSPNGIPPRKPVVQRHSQHLNEKATHESKRNTVNLQAKKAYNGTPDQLSRMQEDETTKPVAPIWKKTGKERMRTVSRDDQLVQRGANPRTGLVSPFITSDSSDDNIGRDYITVGKIQWKDRALPKGRTRSGKWKQNGMGWSLVESPLLSPIAQSINDPISRKVSVKQLEDKLLVEMPGVDNPEPENMTDLQMRDYQEGIIQAYKCGGSAAMIDPGTLPSPRHSTPEGPSTPPNRLQRIRRKMVGSGPSRREGSDDTVVVKTETTPRKATRRFQKLPMATPSNTPTGSSMEIRSEQRIVNDKDSFLGHASERRSCQTPSETQLSLIRASLQREIYPSRQSHPESPAKAKLVDLPASPTLSEYLPRLRLRHPNHFSSLATSSYRRPAQMLPERLRPLEQRRKTMDSACIITTTSTSNQKEPRLKIHRKDESIIIPKMREPLPQVHEKPGERYLQAGTLRKKPSYVTTSTVDNSDSKMTRRHPTKLPDRASPGFQGAEQQQQSRAPLQWVHEDARASCPGAKQGARVAMMENYRSQKSHHEQPGERSTMPPATQSLGLKSGSTVQRPGRKKQESGVGTTHMCGLLGDCDEGVDCEVLRHGIHAKIETRFNKLSIPNDVALQGDGGTWFAGHWADSSKERERSKNSVQEQQKVLVRNRSISRAQLSDINRSIQGSATLTWIQQQLLQLAYHVIQTLHRASPALSILKTPDVRAIDYLRAAKEVILACLYLLLLVVVVLALRKILILAYVLIRWLWHPLGMVFAILSWSIVA